MPLLLTSSPFSGVVHVPIVVGVSEVAKIIDEPDGLCSKQLHFQRIMTEPGHYVICIQAYSHGHEKTL